MSKTSEAIEEAERSADLSKWQACLWMENRLLRDQLRVVLGLAQKLCEEKWPGVAVVEIRDSEDLLRQPLREGGKC